MVVIDCRGRFVKIVPADTGDAGMQTLNFAFLLLPAGTERDPAASLTPEPEPLLLVFLEAVYRFKDGGIFHMTG